MKQRAIKIGVLFILSITIIASIIGCGGGGGNTTITDITPAPRDLSRIGGGVISMEGQPIQGVHVSLRAQDLPVAGARMVAAGFSEATAVTDENGAFSFEMTSMPSDGDRLVLTLSKPGYVDKHAVIRLRENLIEDGMLFLPYEMAALPTDTTQATQATVKFTGGSTQTITPQLVTDPQTGLTTTKTAFYIDDSVEEITFSLPSPTITNVSSVEFTIGGAASAGRSAARTLGYTGEVVGSLYYGDPTNQDALKIFPGEFVTTDDTGSSSSARAVKRAGGAGEEGVLITAGFTQINLENAAGDPITSFANGAEVGVVMRVPDGVINPETGSLVAEGDDVPIFTFNETTGEWKVETNSDGSVKRSVVQRDANGLYVSFSTNHLSWFNLDWKGTRCPNGSPEIRAVDAQGVAINDFTVLTSLTGWGDSPRTTNDGIVQFMNAPADIAWNITVKAEGIQSNSIPINACADVNVTLDQINATSDTTITATCSGSPYDGIDLFFYEGNVRTGSAVTDVSGKAIFKLPSETNITTYGFSDDACEDLQSSVTTTSSAGQSTSINIDFNNTCCPNYTPPLKLAAMSPSASTLLNTKYDVTGYLQFAENVDASTIPDLAITVTQATNTVLSGVAASSVSWLDEQNGYAKVLGFTLADKSLLASGKNYSYSISLNPAQFVSSSGGKLELSGYLAKIPGILSYTASSVSGTFFIGDTSGCKAGTIISCQHPGESIQNEICIPEPAILPHIANGGHVGPCAACYADTACDDGDALTVDVCNNPGTEAAVCDNSPCIVACSSAIVCDDGDANTVDECSNPGTCSAVCNNCIPSCISDTECDDGNATTVDECSNVGTCSAVCNNCIPACAKNSDCVDGNLSTADVCTQPNTCSATCENTLCTIGTRVCETNADCDDGIIDTADVCINANTCSSSCSNEIVWAKAFGGSNNDWGEDVQQTSDGGYVLFGGTTSFGAGGQDIWVLKLDTTGNQMWEKTFGGTGVDIAFSGKQTSDGGYVVAGRTSSSGAGLFDLWALKLDTAGNQIWGKTFGGTGSEMAYSIQQTNDGGYVVAGETDSFGAGNYDAWILKLDSNGNQIWAQTFGSTGDDYAYHIIQTGDGGYVVAGETDLNGAGDQDAWILKLDPNGNQVWGNTYGNIGYDAVYSVAQASDGGYVAVGDNGSKDSGNEDAWIIKLDATGAIVWDKTVGGNDVDYAISVINNSDGNFIVSGSDVSTDRNIWISKYDTYGNLIWSNTHGGTNSENSETHGLVQTIDGGYAIIGTTNSFGSGYGDLWVLKLDSNGGCTGCY